ncbi:MAG: hypothetical protein HY962_06350 [Ignavibacteriae bacterium]|nr:hypothetical protein [Ignavibacteriota bacterium]
MATSSLLSSVFIALICVCAQAQTHRARVEDVNFGNHTFIFSEEKVELSNGELKRNVGKESVVLSAKLGRICYSDFNADGVTDAAFTLQLGINGTICSSAEHYVFTIRNGRLTELFHQSREKGGDMQVVNKTIIITAPYWRQDDAHCCPTAQMTEKYGWRKGYFYPIQKIINE